MWDFRGFDAYGSPELGVEWNHAGMYSTMQKWNLTVWLLSVVSAFCNKKQSRRRVTGGNQQQSQQPRPRWLQLHLQVNNFVTSNWRYSSNSRRENSHSFPLVIKYQNGFLNWCCSILQSHATLLSFSGQPSSVTSSSGLLFSLASFFRWSFRYN